MSTLRFVHRVRVDLDYQLDDFGIVSDGIQSRRLFEDMENVLGIRPSQVSVGNRDSWFDIVLRQEEVADISLMRAPMHNMAAWLLSYSNVGRDPAFNLTDASGTMFWRENGDKIEHVGLPLPRINGSMLSDGISATGKSRLDEISIVKAAPKG